DRNLDTLRFISEQTAARGIDFELGLWMHGYRLGDGSYARYLIEGLNAENHPAYCRFESLPGDFLGGSAHSRRERHRRRQLRFLAHGVRRRQAMRPPGGDRP